MTERRTVRQVQTWIMSASELIFMTEIFFALNKCQWMYQANIAKWKQDVTEDHLILHLPCYVFKKVICVQIPNSLHSDINE